VPPDARGRRRLAALWTFIRDRRTAALKRARKSMVRRERAELRRDPAGRRTTRSSTKEVVAAAS